MRFEALNGLDRPLVLQYTDWLGKALRGDFGTSFQNRVAVAPDILRRLPVTLELAFLAFSIANLIALPLGAVAAFRHRRAADIAISSLATILGAIPNFWLAIFRWSWSSRSLGVCCPQADIRRSSKARRAISSR